MRPDLESPQYNINFSPTPLTFNTNNHTLKKTNPPQKLKSTSSKAAKQQSSNLSRQRWISDAAYYKAAARGFIPGYEISDWLDAEHEYKEMLVGSFLSKCNEDGDITITGLRRLAKEIGVPRPERIDSKIDLIRLIQTASNHRPCFKDLSDELCQEQAGCQWSSECQKLVAEWTR